MDDLSRAVELLTERLGSLERRVASLEQAEQLPASLSASPQLEAVAQHASEAGEGFSLARANGTFPVLGKAMLGIAGAYVLRAVAESGSLPKLAVAAVAITYAILWLVAAARVQAGAWFASTVYACTSALILAPMLLELTLSFKVLPGPAAAGILSVFVIAASVLAWKRDLAPVFWVANGVAAGTALALLVATHQQVPFIAALLLMALLCEYAAGRNHELSVRPLLAAAADAAVWSMIFIYSSPPATRMDYPAIGAAALLLPGCLLYLIYAASLVLRTTLHRQTITVFETGQTMIAFLLAAWSVYVFEPHSPALVLGWMCLLQSAACYAAAFLLFDQPDARRNYYVFSTWAGGLLLAACLLCLPAFWLTACLCLAALAATVLGVRISRLAPGFHGLVFLAVAAAQAGLLVYAFHALIGTLPAHVTVGVWLVAACAALCYAAGKPGPQERWQQQFLHLVRAALAVCALTALLIDGLLFLVAQHMIPEAHHVAILRAFILCALALGLAFAGARWGRAELTRIAYAALAFVAAKLLFEDLRLGQPEFIAASVFLFAVTLIALPRLARGAEKIGRGKVSHS